MNSTLMNLVLIFSIISLLRILNNVIDMTRALAKSKIEEIIEEISDRNQDVFAFEKSIIS